MGIIKRQSILGTVFSYVGVVIGFITSGILFPRMLSPEQIGLLATLVSYSLLYSLIATLGFNSTVIRMFAYFRNSQNNHNGFVALMQLVLLAGIGIFIIIYYLSVPYLHLANSGNSELLVQYTHYILPLTIFGTLFIVLDNYNSVLFNAVRGIFLKEVLLRILILILIILFYFRFIHFENFLILYIVATCIPGLLIFLLLKWEGNLLFNIHEIKIAVDKKRELVSVSLYGMLSSFSGNAVEQVDKLMIASMLGLKQTGIYATAYLFATLIKVPSRTTIKIASTIVAEAWRKNDMAEIQKVYQKSGITMFWIGMLIFLGIWSNIHNVSYIITEKFADGKWVIFYIGLAGLIEMSSGVSIAILNTSRHYRYVTLFTGILVALLIINNLWLIPLWGITGAAVASLISVFIFNAIRAIFLYKHYKLLPYTTKFYWIILVGLLTYGLNLLMPPLSVFILDIAIRSAGITVMYTTLSYYLKISDDLNEALLEVARKVKSILKMK